MEWAGIVLVLVVLAGLTASILRAGPRLREGDLAPDFQLTDQNGTVQHGVAYRGRWLVLYFYPRDATPGCTREACNFRDDILKIRALNAEIIGVSVDDAASHARFATRYHLPFALLADTQGAIAAAYGALFQLGPLRLARRQTFIVTPEGYVGRIFRQVNPTRHATEVAQALIGLQKTPAFFGGEK